LITYRNSSIITNKNITRITTRTRDIYKNKRCVARIKTEKHREAMQRSEQKFGKNVINKGNIFQSVKGPR